MERRLQLKCGCGQIMGEVTLDYTMRTAFRYSLRGYCPKCGRKYSRCINVSARDIKVLRTMLEGNNVAIQKVRAIKTDQNPDDAFIKRQIEHLFLNIGIPPAKIAQLLDRFVPVTYSNVKARCAKLKRQEQTYLATLHSPFTFHQKRAQIPEAYLKIPLGRIINACPFCRLETCNRSHIQCTMQRVSVNSFKIVQLGRDTHNLSEYESVTL